MGPFDTPKTNEEGRKEDGNVKSQGKLEKRKHRIFQAAK